MEKHGTKIDISFVARLAGVSAATVSRTLNHPDLVNPATRKKVDSAIRKSGYIRNRAAQAMHGRRSGTIGIVVPTVSYSIFAEAVQAFNDAVSEKGFTLILASHGYDLDAEYAVIRKMLEHRVDGIALTGLDHSPESFRLLESQSVPAVAIWNYSPQSPFSCIGADNAEAGDTAARHLLALGHRRIALVFPKTGENDRARARLTAADAALKAAGVEVPAKWRAFSPYVIAQSKTVALEILSAPDRPTALLCGNDIIAQGAVFAATKLGLSIPRDVSIIGIGDFPGSAEMEPGLTTVRIPARDIGRRAGLHLVDAIAGGDEDHTERRKLDTELIMRATTGIAPS